MVILNLCFCLLICCFSTTSSLDNKCLKCSSDVDKNCAQNPKEITTFEDCLWGCLTEIESGVTIRRCLTSMMEPCNNEFCKSCHIGNECNNLIFPDDRPVCRHCSPEENDCADIAPAPSILPCLNYKEEDKCYTKIHENGTVRRGCLSDEVDIKCANDDKNCKACNADKVNACNNNLSKNTCVECSSENNNNACIRADPYTEDCKINSSMSVCTYLADKDLIENSCFLTLNKAGIVNRGCSLKIKDYSGEPTSSIKFCKGDNCNSDCIKDMKCIQCSSDSNDKDSCNISNLSMDAEQCPPYTMSCHQCESEDGMQTIRNCGTISNPIHICSTCSEKDGCNNGKPPLSCYTCNSELDANCAQLMNVTSLETKSCKDGDKCVVLIKDGYTIRGCSSDFPDTNCNDSYLCEDCESHNCNRDQYPLNRLLCYQCNNTLECDTVDVCRMYNPQDKCYMFGNASGMTRGCSSDEDENYNKCKDHRNCFKCSTNDCNDLPYTRTSTLSCIKCTNITEKCAWGHKEEDAINCHNELLYYETEDCLTFTHEDNSVTRDCERYSSLCKNGMYNCKKCNKNGCNNKNTKLQKCIVCDSQIPGQENCSDTAEEIVPSTCNSSVQLYTDRGCYTANKDGIIVRGCIIDIEDKEFLEECKINKLEKCDLCNDIDGCNNKDAPGSANILKSFTMCTLIISYLISKTYLI